MKTCIRAQDSTEVSVTQALGIALESERLDIVTKIYETTQDIQLLSYVIDAVLDSSFKLAYRNKVRSLPLFSIFRAQMATIRS